MFKIIRKYENSKHSICKLVLITGAIFIALATFNTALAYSPGTITVEGQEIPIIQSGYVGSTLTGGETQAAQGVIDGGSVASAVNPLNVSDGLNTHIMGHNPGVFSPIANTIQNGKKYVITDYSGTSKVYEFYYVGQISEYTPVEPSSAIYQALFSNGESVTIQYCAYGTRVPQIWRGVISQDQSLLNPQPTTSAPSPRATINTDTTTEEQPKVEESHNSRTSDEQPVAKINKDEERTSLLNKVAKITLESILKAIPKFSK